MSRKSLNLSDFTNAAKKANRAVETGTVREKKTGSTVYKGHSELVTSVSFSSQEAHFVASGSADGTVRIWCLDDDTLSQTLESDDKKRISSCSFTKDGKALVAGDWGYLARLWDVSTGQNVLAFPGHTGKVTSTSFRKEGAMILSGSEDKSVRVWDPRRGVSLQYFANDEVLDCKFSPDGMKLVAACKDSTCLIWDVRQPKEPSFVFEDHSDWVTCCEWSEEGASILTGSNDRTLKLWNARTGEVQRNFEGHQQSINGCRFCGEWVISCSGNRFWQSGENVAIMWDPASGESRRKLNGHTDAIMGVDTNPSTARIATAGMDRHVRIWDAFVPEKKKKRPETESGPRKHECKLGCGKMMIRAFMNEHETKECPNRQVSCQRCGLTLMAKEIPVHDSQDCPLRTYICSCEMIVRAVEKEEHDKEECPNRQVECRNGCGITLRASAIENHEQNLCQERTIICRQGCGAKICARDIMIHQQQECKCREVNCEWCGGVFMAKDIPSHQRKNCSMRTMTCQLGCGHECPAKEMSHHEKKECHLRVIKCSLGCGTSLPAHQEAAHQATACKKRLVDCPLGCGERISADSVGRHRVNCKNRPQLSKIDVKEPVPDEDPEPEPLPEIESPTGPPSPEFKGKFCETCGQAEKVCSRCEEDFCARCLTRLGLPKSLRPLCVTCTRQDLAKLREWSQSGSLRPFKFGKAFY